MEWQAERKEARTAYLRAVTEYEEEKEREEVGNSNFLAVHLMVVCVCVGSVLLIVPLQQSYCVVAAATSVRYQHRDIV